MDFLNASTLMSFFLGIGLAASAGFRVFLPLFVLSLFVHFGSSLMIVNESFQWLGSTSALIVLGVATIVEVLAYYIPVVDNLLDAIAIPMASIAGTILVSSTLVDMGEVGTWAVAIIAGGGTAATISGATASVRAVSTGSSGGTANFLVNTGETLTASILSITSFLWAPLAFLLVIICFYLIYRLIKKIKPVLRKIF